MAAINLKKDPPGDRDNMILHRAHFHYEAEVDTNFGSILLTAIVATGGLVLGYDFGCVNGLIRSNSFIAVVEGPGETKISQNNVALVMSILFCGASFGAISGGALGDRLGRVSLQMAVGFYDSALVLVLIGRLIGGVGVGINSVGTILYMTETCHSSLRGYLIAGYQGCVALGLLVATSIAYLVSRDTDISAYRCLVACQFIWPILLAIGVTFIPESPRHLVNMGRNEEAYTALDRLRNPKPQSELNKQRVGMELSEIYFSHETGLGIARTPHRRIHPLSFSVFLHTMYQCTGINFIMLSLPSLAESDEALSDPLVIALVFSFVRLCATPMYMLIFRKLGQRRTLFFGGLVVSSCHFLTAIVGMAVGLTHEEFVVNRVQLVFMALLLFLVASSWAPAVWIITGEIPCTATRSRDIGISAGVHWLWAVFASVYTPYLIEIEWVRRSAIFLLFAFLSLGSCLFAYYFVPETTFRSFFSANTTTTKDICCHI
ncbi:general substrate transporter [Fusarium oxysporum f. sp. albedinis]|nr:general substrate transporter [Fusarium oxysporum f. sp. albedinis]